jgi:hypothetical protein
MTNLDPLQRQAPSLAPHQAGSVNTPCSYSFSTRQYFLLVFTTTSLESLFRNRVVLPLKKDPRFSAFEHLILSAPVVVGKKTCSFPVLVLVLALARVWIT